MVISAAHAVVARVDCCNDDNDNNDDPWDRICFDNPFYDDKVAGIKDGYNAALNAKYKDGYQVGRATAIEYGIEIGYIQGILTKLLLSLSSIEDLCLTLKKEDEEEEDKEEEEEEEVMRIDRDKDEPLDIHGGRKVEQNPRECANIATSTCATKNVAVDANTKIKLVQNSIQKLQKSINEFPTPDVIFSSSCYAASSTPLSVHTTLVEEERGEIDIATKIQTIRSRFKLLLIQLGIKNPNDYSVLNILTKNPTPFSSTTEAEKSDTETETVEIGTTILGTTILGTTELLYRIDDQFDLSNNRTNGSIIELQSEATKEHNETSILDTKLQQQQQQNVQLGSNFSLEW